MVSPKKAIHCSTSFQERCAWCPKVAIYCSSLFLKVDVRLYCSSLFQKRGACLAERSHVM